MRFLTIFDTMATEILKQMDSSSAQRTKEPQGTCHVSNTTANDVDAPPALSRKHETFLLPPSKVPIGSLRGLRASGIGSLVKVRGIVTRASDVKPLVEVLTYTCESCGYEIYHDISNKRDYLSYYNKQ